MTDRRRNLFVLLLVAGLLVGLARRRRDEADPPRPRPQGRRLADLPGQADEAVDGQQRRHRPHARHHARARRPARRRRAGDPALGRRPDRRLAPGRQERRRGGQPGRHDGADVLLRLGDERPRRQLQAGAGGRERHRRLVGGHRASARPTTSRRSRGRASAPQRDFPNRTTNGLFYLVDTKAKKVLAGPDETRRDLAQEIAEQGHQARPEPEGRRGQARHDRRPRAVAGRQDEERPVLRHAGQAGAERHGHQEPRAELRQRRGRHRRSRSSPSTSRTRAARSGRRPRARSPSAAASRSSRATTRRPPSSTSRSCSTTS